MVLLRAAAVVNKTVVTRYGIQISSEVRTIIWDISKAGTGQSVHRIRDADALGLGYGNRAIAWKTLLLNPGWREL
jgi:hypothetical protein